MIIQAFRGPLLETTHTVRVVVVEADTNHTTTITHQSGPPVCSTWRSAGKPIQLWACLEAMNDPEFTDEQIAIGAASHSGQPRHIAVVNSLLDRFGATSADLRCGAEPPAHAETRTTLIKQGRQPSALHNDCSGKHAMMLGAVAHKNWPKNYLPPEHPLQQQVLSLVSQWCEEDPRMAVDGCGVPTFGLEIAGMARAWCRLATTMKDRQFRGVPDHRSARIGWAMQRHPWMVSGDNRIDLAVAQRAAEPIVGKIGAQGVFCLAVPERRMGIAIKTLCGNENALATAINHILNLRAPGSIAPTQQWPWATIRNVVGEEVGLRVVDKSENQ